MSEITGGDTLNGRLTAFDAELRQQLATRTYAALVQMQQDAVARAPIRTGRLRDALQSADAIRFDLKEFKGEFGFRTKEIQKKAFYAFWIETGTQSYQAGGKRRTGRTATGQIRYRTVRRYVPARPARPFMQPAYLDFVQRMKLERQRAVVAAGVKAAFNISVS